MPATSSATERTVLRPSKGPGPGLRACRVYSGPSVGGATQVLPPAESDCRPRLSPSFSRVRTEIRRRRLVLGLNYCLVSGVCATTIVSTASQLSVLAEHCGRDSEPGAVFITRGVGSILGAIISARYYKVLDGNHALLLVCMAAAVTLLVTPFVTAVWGLHVIFGVVGLTGAIMDTGVQLLSCTVHGDHAGVWLGANGVSFSVFASLVPLVAWMTADLIIQFSIASVVAVVAVVCLFYTGPVDIVRCTKKGEEEQETRLRRAPAPEDITSIFWTYRIEMLASCMVFLLIGGKATVTAYLEQYLNDVGVLPPSSAALLLVVVYSTVTMSRILGTVDQKFFNTGTLYTHLTVLFIAGSAAFLMIMLLPDSGTALYVGLGLYGFCTGPTTSFTYDLVNRLTGGASETGMSIVMFGIMVGASLLPYITSQLWITRLGPSALPAVLLASMLFPLPLLLATHTLRDEDQEVGRLGGRAGYTPVSSSDDEEDGEETKEPPATVVDEEVGGGEGGDGAAAIAVRT